MAPAGLASVLACLSPLLRHGAPRRCAWPRVSGRKWAGGVEALRLFQGGPRRLVRGRRPGWRAVAAACASRRLARPGIQKSGRLRSRGKIARGVASSGFGRGGSAPTGRTRPASGARAAGRWRRALRPAHMACEAGPAPLGPASTREEAYGCAGRPRRCARASPLPGGEAGLALPAPVACAERWPLAALCRELKMEDAAARESGRVSHPHKGKGLSLHGRRRL